MLFILSPSAWGIGKKLQGYIYKIEPSKGLSLHFMDNELNKHLFHLDQDQHKKIYKAIKAFQEKSGVEIHASKKRGIKQLHLIEESFDQIPLDQILEAPELQPQTLSSWSEIEKIFDEMDTREFSGKSLCFRRANWWSFKNWMKRGFTLKKIFLFYTKKANHFADWNYHVIPAIDYLNPQTGQVQTIALDGFYSRTPQTITEWLYDHIHDIHPSQVPYLSKNDPRRYLSCPRVDHYERSFYQSTKHHCFYFVTDQQLYRYRNVPGGTDDDRVQEFWNPEFLLDTLKGRKSLRAFK